MQRGSEDSLEFTRKWVNWGTRQLYECFADVSECDDTYSCLNTVKSALNNTEADTKDLVKVVLTGEISAETEFDTEYISHELSSNYFSISVNDSITTKNKTKPLLFIKHILLPSFCIYNNTNRSSCQCFFNKK